MSRICLYSSVDQSTGNGFNATSQLKLKSIATQTSTAYCRFIFTSCSRSSHIDIFFAFVLQHYSHRFHPVWYSRRNADITRVDSGTGRRWISIYEALTECRQPRASATEGFFASSWVTNSSSIVVTDGQQRDLCVSFNEEVARLLNQNAFRGITLSKMRHVSIRNHLCVT